MTQLDIAFGEFELFVFIGCALAGGVSWLLLVRQHAQLAPMVGRAPRFPSLISAFFFVNAINIAVLLTLASADVRRDPYYIGFYVAMGLVAPLPLLFALRLLGVDRADIAERGNRAAAVLQFSVLVAGALAYAGANIGDGPGYHVVVAATALAYAGLLLVAVLHVAFGRTMYRILVDRERGTAFRFGCLLVACGLTFGRSVAGDWGGLAPMVSDFVPLAWPALALLVVDVVLARITHAHEPDGSIVADHMIGALHLAAAVTYVASLGAPT